MAITVYYINTDCLHTTTTKRNNTTSLFYFTFQLLICSIYCFVHILQLLNNDDLDNNKNQIIAHIHMKESINNFHFFTQPNTNTRPDHLS